MIKLVVKLNGQAEEEFKELLEKTQADKKDIVLDALALLSFAVSEVVKGKSVAIFDPKTKEATVFTLPSLNLVKTDIHTELQNVLNQYLADNHGIERKIADEFQIAISTVKRWASGTARPDPRLAQTIIDYIKSKSQAD